MLQALVLVVVVTAMSISNAAIHKCNMVDSRCYLRKIQVTRERYRFELSASQPDSITQVVVEKSSIPLLGPDVCNTFRNLSQFEVRAAGIEELHVHAFQNCSKLNRLALFDQNIYRLPDGVFSSLSRLLQLELVNLNLEIIDEQTFSRLTGLWTLELGGNKLTNLSSQNFEKNKEVYQLGIESNELSDLNVTQLKSTFPRLQEVKFNDNDMSCRRIKSLVEELSDQGIRSIFTPARRERFYKTRKVGGYECLAETQWSSVYYSKVGQSLTVAVVDETSQIAGLKHEILELQSLIKNLANKVTTKL